MTNLDGEVAKEYCAVFGNHAGKLGFLGSLRILPDELWVIMANVVLLVRIFDRILCSANVG